MHFTSAILDSTAKKQPPTRRTDESRRPRPILTCIVRLIGYAQERWRRAAANQLCLALAYRAPRFSACKRRSGLRILVSHTCGISYFKDELAWLYTCNNVVRSSLQNRRDAVILTHPDDAASHQTARRPPRSAGRCARHASRHTPSTPWCSIGCDWPRWQSRGARNDR